MATQADMSETHASSRQTSQRSPLVFLIVAATLAITLVGPNLPTPLYPIYQRDFGLTPIIITAIYAVYAGSLIPSLLLFGPLSDAVGRRRVMYMALAFGIVGSAVIAVADNGWMLVVGRLFQGLAVGSISGAATAALRETEPTDNRARAASTASAAMVGGSALGPIFAGLLVQYLPAPRLLSFVIHAILLAAIGGVLLAYKEAPRSGSWAPQRPELPPQVRGVFIRSGSAAFLVWSVTALFLSLIPSVMKTSLDITNTAVTGLVVTLMLGSSATVQLTAKRLPQANIQIIGLLGVVVGLILLNLSSSVGSLVMLIASALIAGVGQGLAFLGSMTRVNLAAPPDKLGNVISSFYVVVYTGVGVPVIGVGLLATVISLQAAVAIFSVVVGVLCTILAAALVVTRDSSNSKIEANR